MYLCSQLQNNIVFIKIPIYYKIVLQYLVDGIIASKYVSTLSCNTYFKFLVYLILIALWVDQSNFHGLIDVRVFHIFYQSM